jgi:hypothetical protein
MIASSFLMDGILFSLVPATLYLVEPLSGHATAILAADSISFVAGALVLGRLGDRMGRRSTLVTSLLIYTAGAAAFAAAFQLGRLDLAVAIATTSLVNFGVGGETGPAYAALAEYAPARRRGWVMVLAPNFWNVGAALIAALSLRYAELTGDPRAATAYTFATAVVLALLLLIIRYHIPESPRWLLARGRAREAEEVSRRYGVRVPAGNPAGAGGGLGRYAWRLLLLTASFTIQLLAYNVASYYLPYAPGFAYGYAAALNVAVANVGASVGAFLLLPLIDRSRRSSFLLSMAGGLATALVLMAAHGGPPAIYMVALFANMIFVEWAWAVVSALESELFPTAHRSTAVGLVTALSWLVNTAAIIWGGEAGAWSLLWLLAALWGSGVAIAALWRALGIESSGRELEELGREGSSPRSLPARRPPFLHNLCRNRRKAPASSALAHPRSRFYIIESKLQQSMQYCLNISVFPPYPRMPSEQEREYPWSHYTLACCRRGPAPPTLYVLYAVQIAVVIVLSYLSVVLLGPLSYSGISLFYFAYPFIIVFTLWWGFWGALAGYIGCVVGAGLMVGLPLLPSIAYALSDLVPFLVMFALYRGVLARLGVDPLMRDLVEREIRGYRARRSAAWFWFILLNGLVLNALSAEIGVGIQYAMGLVPPDAYWFWWIGWFVGDLLAMVILTPILVKGLTSMVERYGLINHGWFT